MKLYIRGILSAAQEQTSKSGKRYYLYRWIDSDTGLPVTFAAFAPLYAGAVDYVERDWVLDVKPGARGLRLVSVEIAKKGGEKA